MKKEAKEYILDEFKNYSRKYNVEFPTETMKEFYVMLNNEDKNDDFGEANKFKTDIQNFTHKILYDNSEEDEEIAVYLIDNGWDTTSAILEFLYEEKSILD